MKVGWQETEYVGYLSRVELSPFLLMPSALGQKYGSLGIPCTHFQCLEVLSCAVHLGQEASEKATDLVMSLQ